MATAASYILNIKDITYVSGTVEMNVQLGNYIAQSSQDTVDVQNELLSDITIPSYTAATGEMIIATKSATVYVPIVGPTPYMTSIQLTDGYQYALATITMSAINSSVVNEFGRLHIRCNYSWDHITWYESAYLSQFYMSPIDADDPTFVSNIENTAMIPGKDTTTYLYVRWAIYNDQDAAGDFGYSIVDVCSMLNVIPRHLHNWVQTGQADNKMQAVQIDNTSLIGATPETITCTINGGTPFAIACASPSFNNSIDILGKATAMGKPLVTGINNIVFTSTTKCSVTPTATYMALPT